MKKLEVLTAQNVTISYQLASILLRAVASVIDLICLFLYLLIVASILGTSFSPSSIESSMVLVYLFGFSVFFLYSPVCESIFKGQTLGKKIVGIRVVQVNGEKPRLEQVLMRWSFRMVDLWMSFGAIAMLSSSASSKGQRIGDNLAGTTLIRTSPSTVYTLQDVQSIKTQSNYKPTYYGVTRFNDEDMMIIKKALARLEKKPNKRHKELCIHLAEKCAEKLQLDQTPEKKGTFLKTLLNDYIVLTR